MPGVMGFEFDLAGGKRSQRVESAPFVMMVLGDFAGNAGQGNESDPAWLMQVPVRNVDIDNIDQLWNHFAPKLVMDIEGSGVTIEARDLDDFHPDQLYRKQALFGELRQLRHRLLDPATSAEALAEVMLSSPQPVSGEAIPDVDDANESGDNMFERLLGERRAQPPATAAASAGLESLLQKVVGPHVVHAPDPKVDTAIDAVDKAIAESMRRILHHPEFQALESAWRSLYELVHETEIGEELQLKVCNISKTGLLNGLPASADAMEDSGLYQLLVGRFRRAADDDGLSLLVCNYFFSGSVDDVTLLASLGSLADMHDAAVIAAAESELIGSHALVQQPAASDWTKQDNPFWKQLRESPLAQRIGLALPRIIGRLPYGRNTDQIESFDFEEIVTQEHDSFLWTNPSLACAGLLARSFTGHGWNMNPDQNTDIGGLPAFTYEENGEQKMLPCAEMLLPERSAEAILGLGLMPIVSFRNRDMARLLRFQSIAEPLSALSGPWG